MDLDRLDLIAIGGILAVVALSPAFSRPFIAAILAGFSLSLSTWRLYDGRPGESVAWLVWAGAAVALVVVPPGPLALASVAIAVLVGAALLFASRRVRSLTGEAPAEEGERPSEGNA